MEPHPSSPGSGARRRVNPASALLGLVVVLGLVVLALTRPWSDSSGTDGDAAPAPTASSPSAPEPTSTPTSSPAPSPTPTPTPTPEVVEFTIAGGGDVLVHNTVYQAAETADGYDFGPLMADTVDYLQGADLALCNLEVPLLPPTEEPSGYPTFGSPDELAQNLADIGWNGCSTANNHALDRGLDALNHTLDVFDDAGLGHVGTARSAAEADQAQLYELERGGRTITVAQIAGTFSTNGIPVPDDTPWAVQLLDADLLIEQARDARADGADLVVASVHCCSEYVTAPDDTQLEVAEALADSGQVDLVLGHHAHVPQPIERLPGGPGERGMWVAYGLGNFISDQSVECCREETATGILAFFTVTATGQDAPRIEDASWTPVTMERSARSVHPLPDLLDDGATSVPTSAAELDRRHQQVRDIMGSEPATERTEAPESTGDPARVLSRGTPAD